MKIKKTIKQDLISRNYDIPPKFMVWLNYALTYFMGLKYHCNYNVIDDINEEKGPAFVLFNHLSRFDHVFLSQIMYPRRYNILVAHNEFYRLGQHILFKLDKIIPKTIFSIDMVAMKAIKKIISRGGTVCFAPEGMTTMDGQNHPVAPGTGHLLKHYGIPVYYVELRGQYMVASKVCLDERRGGECFATIRKLYTPEDLESMTYEEIEDDLNNRLRHDEYAWQKEHHYKYKMKGQSCKNLEDLCFMCPKCGKMFTMKSEGNRIYCTSCGNATVMNEYYDFEPEEGSIIPETPSRWNDLQRMRIIKDIRNNKDYSFSIKVKLGKLPKYIPIKGTSILCGEGVITIDHDGVHYVGTKDGEPFEYHNNFHHFFTILSALDFKYFDLYFDNEYFDFFPVKGEEGKVGYIQLLIEEMHRLHVNTLKNFTWLDYMYE